MIQTIEIVPPVPAQELTAHDHAIIRQQHLRALRHSANQIFVEMGRVLQLAYAREDWRELGYSSFASYTEDTLGKSKSESYDLLRIARIADTYPELEPRILDAGVSNMRTVLPEIKDETDYRQVEQWIDAANVNTWRELQAVVREEPQYSRQRPAITCPHCGGIFEI